MTEAPEIEAQVIETPVIDRPDLNAPVAGPVIVEEYDSTCIVPPDWTASLDPTGNIVLTRGSGQ